MMIPAKILLDPFLFPTIDMKTGNLLRKIAGFNSSGTVLLQVREIPIAAYTANRLRDLSICDMIDLQAAA